LRLISENIAGFKQAVASAQSEKKSDKIGWVALDCWPIYQL
jgi:hypothetical protein